MGAATGEAHAEAAGHGGPSAGRSALRGPWGAGLRATPLPALSRRPEGLRPGPAERRAGPPGCGWERRCPPGPHGAGTGQQQGHVPLPTSRGGLSNLAEERRARRGEGRSPGRPRGPTRKGRPLRRGCTGERAVGRREHASVTVSLHQGGGGHRGRRGQDDAAPRRRGAPEATPTRPRWRRPCGPRNAEGAGPVPTQDGGAGRGQSGRGARGAPPPSSETPGAVGAVPAQPRPAAPPPRPRPPRRARCPRSRSRSESVLLALDMAAAAATAAGRGNGGAAGRGPGAGEASGARRKKGPGPLATAYLVVYNVVMTAG